MEYEKEYDRRIRPDDYNSFNHGLYDALWALAFALNRTMTMVESGDIGGTDCLGARGSLVPLHEFAYRNEMMGCLIQWNLQRTNFTGVTVHLT